MKYLNCNRADLDKTIYDLLKKHIEYINSDIYDWENDIDNPLGDVIIQALIRHADIPETYKIPKSKSDIVELANSFRLVYGYDGEFTIHDTTDDDHIDMFDKYYGHIQKDHHVAMIALIPLYYRELYNYYENDANERDIKIVKATENITKYISTAIKTFGDIHKIEYSAMSINGSVFAFKFDYYYPSFTLVGDIDYKVTFKYIPVVADDVDEIVNRIYQFDIVRFLENVV